MTSVEGVVLNSATNDNLKYKAQFMDMLKRSGRTYGLLQQRDNCNDPAHVWLLTSGVSLSPPLSHAALYTTANSARSSLTTSVTYLRKVQLGHCMGYA